MRRRPRRRRAAAPVAESPPHSARPSGPMRPIPRTLRRRTSAPRRRASDAARICHVSRSTVGPLMYVLRWTMPNRTNSACSRPGNQSQHARLITPFQLRLEADETVVIARELVLPQLHHGVRPAARARIVQPDRLHRPEAQRVGAPVRHHLDGQTALEEFLAVEVVNGRRFRVRRLRRRTARTRRASAGNSDSRPPRHRRRTPGPATVDRRPSDADRAAAGSVPARRRNTLLGRSSRPARSD